MRASIIFLVLFVIAGIIITFIVLNSKTIKETNNIKIQTNKTNLFFKIVDDYSNEPISADFYINNKKIEYKAGTLEKLELNLNKTYNFCIQKENYKTKSFTKRYDKIITLPQTFKLERLPLIEFIPSSNLQENNTELQVAVKVNEGSLKGTICIDWTTAIQEAQILDLPITETTSGMKCYSLNIDTDNIKLLTIKYKLFSKLEPYDKIILTIFYKDKDCNNNINNFNKSIEIKSKV